MTLSLRRALIAGAALLALAAAAPAADAKSFKWANDGDANSMDPYARNETFLLSFTQNIYDPLIRRDANLRLESALLDTALQLLQHVAAHRRGRKVRKVRNVRRRRRRNPHPLRHRPMAAAVAVAVAETHRRPKC